ncbi:CHAD domain-containing protein [Longivirga aurantiaca]|uniref:CHAD domain-containing protein n=1 Tax=Longivirga aurantiaca TaxID=1837743 RepID=A0ABW1SW67_9ACTN
MTDEATGQGAGVRPDPDLVLPPPVPVGPHSTAGVAVLAHLRQHVGALLRADAGLDDDLEEAVHQARVSARRLRSGLKVYGDLLQGGTSTRLRAELGWYAGLLSPSRDLEVFGGLLTSLAADSGTTRPVEYDAATDFEALAGAVVPWLQARRAGSHAAALVDVRSARASALRRDLVRTAREPLFTAKARKPAHKVLAPRVLEADRRAAARFESLDERTPADSWHLARIAAKRARYAAEVGIGPLGRPAQELARLWIDVTEPLGAAQDAVVQRELVLARIADPAAPLSAGEAFTCGMFVASTHDRELVAQTEARDGWAASRRRHRDLRRSLGG